MGHQSRSCVLARHWAVGAVMGAVVGTAAYLLLLGWDAAPGPQFVPRQEEVAASATRPESPGLSAAAQGVPTVPVAGSEVVVVLEVDALLEVRREEREGVPFEESGEATFPVAPAGQRPPLPSTTVVPEVPPMIPLSSN